MHPKKIAIVLLFAAAPNTVQAFGAFATLCEASDGAAVANYYLGADRRAFLYSLDAPTYPDLSLSDLTLADCETRQKLVMSDFSTNQQRETAKGLLYDSRGLRKSSEYEQLIDALVREGVAAEQLPFGGEDCACNLYYQQTTSVPDTLMEDAQ
jgi:hypothetical protein